MAIHIRSRLWDSSLLIRDAAMARQVARIVLIIGAAYGLVLFAIAGDHAHFVLLTDRKTAGRFARAVEAALTMICQHQPGFRPAAFFDVATEGHLENLVAYVLGQHRKHGLEGDPLLEATNLLDLLSIRLVDPACAARLAAAVPRIDRTDLVAHLGAELVMGTDPARILDACSVVSGGQPLDGMTDSAIRTRRAALRTARGLGLPVGVIASTFGVHRTTVRASLRLEDPVADRALGLALGLVQQLAPTGFPTGVSMAPRVWTPGGPTRTSPARDHDVS